MKRFTIIASSLCKFCLLVSLADAAWAGTYWVSSNGAATWANCQSATALSGSSACSLATANTNASAGDTVYLRAGTYSISGNGIAPSRSGSSYSNRIIFSAYNNETVTLVGASASSQGVYLSGKNYVKVHGITFNNFNHPMLITGGSKYNEISHSTFSGYYGSAPGDWVGSRIRSNSQYNHVHHSTFTDYGLHNGNDEAVVFGTGIEASTSDSAQYNLIEDSTFAYGGHHVVEFNGTQNVFRNNYIHNENHFLWNGTLYGNRITFTVGDLPYVGRNLIEGNRIAYGGETSESDECGGSGGTLASPYNIIRKNMYYKCLLYGIYVSTYGSGLSAYNNRIYHNTFWNNGITTTAQAKPCYGNSLTHAILVNEGSGTLVKNNVIKNNLFWQNVNRINATRPVINASGNVPVYNTVASNFNQTSDPKFVNISETPDPMNRDQFDFHLQSGSPAIDAGQFLTTIASASGSGTSFQVADAGYFFDSWGMSAIASATVTGDTIQLAGQAQTAVITAVNYATNTITVNTPLSWTNGQGVSLTYKGSSPDMGAYEFDSGSTETLLPPVLRIQN